MRYSQNQSTRSSASTPKSLFLGGENSTSEKSSNQNISLVDLSNLQRVDVLWLDAVCTGGSEWQTMEEMEEAVERGPSLVRTCGFLVKDDPEYIAIVDTFILDGDACGYVHVLPRGMIKQVTRLETSYDE